MQDKSKLKVIILFIITVVVVLVSFLLKSNEEQKEKDINIVTNYSDFYTVNSCLYRFLTYVSSNDNESLLLVLDENYKSQNDITKDNIINIFNDITSGTSFNSRKMYYQELNNNITKYYVYGYVESYVFGSPYSTNTIEKYFIVYLDKENQTFSIEPYNGEIFIGGEVNE